MADSNASKTSDPTIECSIASRRDDEFTERVLLAVDLTPETARKFQDALTGNDSDVLLAVEKAIGKSLGHADYECSDFVRVDIASEADVRRANDHDSWSAR